MDNYRIVMTGCGQGIVYRNGEEVNGVVAVKFPAKVGEVNTIELTFNAGIVEIESECVEKDV